MGRDTFTVDEAVMCAMANVVALNECFEWRVKLIVCTGEDSSPCLEV
jgi:hypothetical protein